MLVSDIGIEEYGRRGVANATADVRIRVDEEPEWQPWDFYTTGQLGNTVTAVQYDSTQLLVRYCVGHVKDQHLRHRQGMGACSAFNWITPDGRRVVNPPPDFGRDEPHEWEVEGITNAWSGNESQLRYDLGLELKHGAYYTPLKGSRTNYEVGISCAFDVEQLHYMLHNFLPEWRLALIKYHHGIYWNAVRMVDGEATEHDTMPHNQSCGWARDPKYLWNKGCPEPRHYVPIGQRRHVEDATLLYLYEGGEMKAPTIKIPAAFGNLDAAQARVVLD